MRTCYLILLLVAAVPCAAQLSPSPLPQAPGTLQADTLPSYLFAQAVSVRPMAAGNLDSEERKHYRRLRHHAIKVYPYALEALRQLEARDSVAAHADRRRDARRYRKTSESELKDEFGEALRNLSRSQGSVLISMIERQTQQPFFDLLKTQKSGVTALFWQGLGRTYGYNLREGYDPADDPILEMVLSEFAWPEYRAQATAKSGR
jgi:hypothetical protein